MHNRWAVEAVQEGTMGFRSRVGTWDARGEFPKGTSSPEAGLQSCDFGFA